MKKVVSAMSVSGTGKGFLLFLLCLSGMITAKASSPVFVRAGTTDDPATKKTVTWEQDQTGPALAIMRIAKKSEGESNFADSTGRILNFTYNSNAYDVGTNGGADIPKRAYSVTVTGLEPGTTYIYQVGDGANWSNTLEFTTATAAPNRFSFYVLGDLQAYSDTLNDPGGTGWLRTIARNYANPATQPLFSIQVGDLVDREHVYNYYKIFGDVCDDYPAFANTDMVSVMGNHEYYRGLNNTANLTDITVPPRGDLSKFLYGMPATNNPADVGTGTYSVDYGNVHIAVLDLFDRNGLGSASTTPAIDAEAEWLRNDLANCNKRWKIVTLHYPLYEAPNGAGVCNPIPYPYATTVFAPIFEEYGVQFVFAGHTHVDRRIQVRNGVVLQQGPNSNVTPNAPTYITCGNLSQYDSSTTYYRVDVDDDKMVFSSFRHDGNSGYSLTIKNWVNAVTVSGAGGANRITTEGGTLQMEATALPDYASDKSVTWTITTVPAANVATISNSGLLTAKGNGTVTVIAVANDGSGESGKATVYITGQPGADAYFPAGSGTADDPFQITTADELAAMAALVNAGEAGYNPANYMLMDDINLDLAPYNGGAGWTTIGAASNPFLGVFDGNHKTISGLYINQTGSNKGLFGQVEGSAIIKDLDVNGEVDNTATSATWDECVGGIVGRLQGNALIQDCSFSGSVTDVKTSIGGIVGYLNGSAQMTNCRSDATVANTSNGNNGRLGGLVGGLEGSGIISNSYFSGTVIAAGERTGGIAGHINGTGIKISNCYVTGEVRGWCWSTGGIVGFAQSAGTIENCYVTGAISENNNQRIGGILGRANSGSLAVTIQNCVVLSPSIQGGSGNQARIHGDPVTVSAPFTYSNNYAWEGITNSIGTTDWGECATNNRNGESVTAAEVNDAGFFQELFASAAPGTWTYAENKLPGLTGEPVDMPEYLTLPTSVPTITPPQLHAWMDNGFLHISGLAGGKGLKLYDTSGLLVKQGIAGSDAVSVSLNLPGVYIVKLEDNTLKVTVF